MLIYNAITKHVYSTANQDILAKEIAAKNWPTGEFAGFVQWKQSGRVVRKGEAGVPVLMMVDKNVEKEDKDDKNKVKVRKTRYVFNIAQTEPQ